MPPLPAVAAESYGELASLDEASRVRLVRPGGRVELDPEALDLEILILVAELGHLLSSQIHRRFNPGRSATTTQRRLKRLADAGMVERFQFHRPDGGGVPMCYAISLLGCRLLAEHGHDVAHLLPDAGLLGEPGAGDHLGGRLDEARQEIHVAGWALALGVQEETGGLWGPGRSMLRPPRSNGPARGPLTPAELALPGGRVAHDFLHRLRSGELVEAERFDSIRPNAIVSLRRGPGVRDVDVLLERDDRLSAESWTSKLERYDHFLAGWSLNTSRYGASGRATPIVLFICRDRPRARAAARRADAVLRASRAYAGEYPWSWQYPGRESIMFTGERDAHEGLLYAYVVARLPPEARAAAAGGDPAAAESEVVIRPITSPGERVPEHR